jgi:hypothetical protein
MDDITVAHHLDDDLLPPPASVRSPCPRLALGTVSVSVSFRPGSGLWGGGGPAYYACMVFHATSSFAIPRALLSFSSQLPHRGQATNKNKPQLQPTTAPALSLPATTGQAGGQAYTYIAGLVASERSSICMASSAGGGLRSPPATAAPRVVMDSLIEVREGATRLQTMLLEESPTPSIAAAAAAAGATSEVRQTLDGMMSSLSSAMSALDTTGGGGGQGQQGRRRKRGGAAVARSGPLRRSSNRRR